MANQELIDKFSNAKPSHGGVCTVCLIINGKERWYQNQICAAFMSYGHVDREKTEAVYNSLWKNGSRKQAERYWSFILDPVASPWRQALKGREIFYNSKGQMVAFGIKDMSVSAQTLVNLMIASRLSNEFPDAVRAFNCFLDHGFSEHEALFLSTAIHLNEKEEPVLSHGNSNHFAFDYNKNSEFFVDLDAMKEGKPHSTAPSFNRGGYYRPCNKIWYSKDKKFHFLPKITREKHYTGRFKHYFWYQHRNQSIPTQLPCLEETVSILKKEREQWL